MSAQPFSPLEVFERDALDAYAKRKETFGPVDAGAAKEQSAAAREAISNVIAAHTALAEAHRWRPIASAPKSFLHPDGHVEGISILGYLPAREGDNYADPTDGQWVVWWEPGANGGNGEWTCGGDYPVYPVCWKPLSPSPTAAELAQGGVA